MKQGDSVRPSVSPLMAEPSAAKRNKSLYQAFITDMQTEFWVARYKRWFKLLLQVASHNRVWSNPYRGIIIGTGIFFFQFGPSQLPPGSPAHFYNNPFLFTGAPGLGEGFKI